MYAQACAIRQRLFEIYCRKLKVHHFLTQYCKHQCVHVYIHVLCMWRICARVQVSFIHVRLHEFPLKSLMYTEYVFLLKSLQQC